MFRSKFRFRRHEEQILRISAARFITATPPLVIFVLAADTLPKRALLDVPRRKNWRPTDFGTCDTRMTCSHATCGSIQLQCLYIIHQYPCRRVVLKNRARFCGRYRVSARSRMIEIYVRRTNDGLYHVLFDKYALIVSSTFQTGQQSQNALSVGTYTLQDVFVQSFKLDLSLEYLVNFVLYA